MSKRAIALIATLFAAGLVAGGPVWADRGNAHFDRGDVRGDRGGARLDRDNVRVDRGNIRVDRGGNRFDGGRGNRFDGGRGNHALGWGLGLLAGSAILLAASQPRQVMVSAPVAVYAPPAPPRAVYSPPSVQWWYYCAQSAGYYPYVNYCPSGWTKVPATPLQ